MLLLLLWLFLLHSVNFHYRFCGFCYLSPPLFITSLVQWPNLIFIHFPLNASRIQTKSVKCFSPIFHNTIILVVWRKINIFDSLMIESSPFSNQSWRFQRRFLFCCLLVWVSFLFATKTAINIVYHYHTHWDCYPFKYLVCIIASAMPKQKAKNMKQLKAKRWQNENHLVTPLRYRNNMNRMSSLWLGKTIRIEKMHTHISMNACSNIFVVVVVILGFYTCTFYVSPCTEFTNFGHKIWFIVCHRFPFYWKTFSTTLWYYILLLLLLVIIVIIIFVIICAGFASFFPLVFFCWLLSCRKS